MSEKVTEEQIKQRIEQLATLDDAQWESLCKGCGVCCLLKHTRRQGIYYASVACNHLNLETRKCDTYETRLKHRMTCNKVNVPVVLRSGLLPNSCGYVEYIYGPADKQIKPDFKKIIHEHAMIDTKPELSDASVEPRRAKTLPGPWDFLIPESLQWCTRAVELRDKYDRFCNDVITRWAKKQNNR